MYETSLGFRVLRGTERYLFCLAARGLADVVYHSDDDPFDLIDIAVFDEMTKTQKLNTIKIVCKALLDPQFPAPKLTSIIEATVAAIYKSLMISVDVEIDFYNDDELQQAVLSVCNEHGTNYSRAIEDIQDRILWDTDWELGGLQDEHPDLAKIHKLQLGIDNDYFTEIADDFGNNQNTYNSILEMCLFKGE